MPKNDVSQEIPLEEEILEEVKKTSKVEKDNILYTSYFETDTFILEQICPIKYENAGRAERADTVSDIKFIYYGKQSASIDYLDYYLYEDKEIRPIDDKLLAKGVINLSTGIEEYGTTSDLAKDIYDFLYDNFEVPPFYEKFLPYIVLFSWVYEKFPFVPYVHFVGLTGTGKTTAAEALASICYKTIDAAGAITMSPIFRIASTWRGTLFLDEFEPEGESYKDMISFLKSGVGNRAVLRTEGDRKREVEPYLIKSMKIFTSEHPISSAGLRSRMFVVEMQKSKRRIPLIKQKRFYDKAQELRNKLLLWRLRNLGKINLEEIEFGYEELSGFDRRVQQVLTPIYYLSDEVSRKTMLEFAKIQEQETKRERLESLEGEVFQAISENLPDPTLKLITDEINKDHNRRPYSEKKIANIIRQILQFGIKQVGHDKISTIQIVDNSQRYDDLLTYFGIDDISKQSTARSAESADVSQDLPMYLKDALDA